MSMDALTLPDNPEMLAKTIADHCIREEAKMWWRWTRWLLAQAYLDGNRVFSAFDPYNVRIATFNLKKDGKMPVQVTELLSHCNRVAGAMAAFDTTPAITQNDNTLSSIRGRSMAQLLADSLVSAEQAKQIHTTFSFLLSTLGCAGIQGHIVDSPAIGLTAELEVVNPREVFPFPSLGWDMTKRTGIIRQRMMPLTQLETKRGKPFTDEEMKKLDYYRKPIGEAPMEQSSDFPGYSSNQAVSSSVPAGNTTPGYYYVVKVRELWMEGPANTCTRYVCTSGRMVLEDRKYVDEIAYVPLGWARFYETLGFYGAGMFDLCFSMVREFEKMIEDLIQNTKDLNRYPFLILPQGTVSDKTMFKDTGNSLRILFAQMEQSYTGSDQIKPTVIEPINSGDAPGRTAAYLRNMLEEILPVRDILKNKGRVDSLQGLRYLDEKSNGNIAIPVQNMVSCYSTVYRYLTAAGLMQMSKSPRAIPIGKLNLDLVGASINWDEGTVTFQKGRNPIPDMARLVFSIKDQSPKSKAVRKQELMELYQAQLTDRDGFIILNLEEALDFALDCGEERAAYETLTQNCLRIYNDGITPGAVWLNPYTERPEFQRRLLKRFLSGIAVRSAKPKVVDALIKYDKLLMTYMGMMVPNAAPDPYADVLLQQQQQAMLSQQNVPQLAMS